MRVAEFDEGQLFGGQLLLLALALLPLLLGFVRRFFRGFGGRAHDLEDLFF